MKKSTKKLTQALLATALLAGIAAPSAGAASVTFKDVPKSNVHFDDIYNLTDRGVLTGYKDGTYKPTGHLTRAEAAVILTRALDLDTEDPFAPGFKDVKKGAWYYDSVATLADYGIINGFEDGTFRPQDKLTRSQMAMILTEAYSLYTLGGKTPFKDVPEDVWFSDAVHALHYFEVTNGVTPTSFAPKSFVRRDAIASFVVRSEEVPEEMKMEVLIDFITEIYNDEANGMFMADLNKADNVLALEIAYPEEAVRVLVRSDAFLLLPYFAFYSATIEGSTLDLTMADEDEINDEFLRVLGVTETSALSTIVGKSVTVTFEDYQGNFFDYTFTFTAK